MTRDSPTEPPGPREDALPTHGQRMRAVTEWLEENPLPRTLRPFLVAAVLGAPDEARARSAGTAVERLPAWERCFARWASRTVEQVVLEIWERALSLPADEEE